MKRKGLWSEGIHSGKECGILAGRAHKRKTKKNGAGKRGEKRWGTRRLNEPGIREGVDGVCGTRDQPPFREWPPNFMLVLSRHR